MGVPQDGQADRGLTTGQFPRHAVNTNIQKAPQDEPEEKKDSRHHCCVLKNVRVSLQSQVPP